MIVSRETVALAEFGKVKSRWKRSAGTFPRPQCCKRDTGRSGLVRSALEKLSLFSPTFSVRQEHGAGNFAVCGRRLRGHVPSKNTSPTALSWISLMGQRFRFFSFLHDTFCRMFHVKHVPNAMPIFEPRSFPAVSHDV